MSGNRFFLKMSGGECARCGACSVVCPVYRVDPVESLTARGKMHLLSLAVDGTSPLFRDIFSRCLLCGACENTCSRSLPLTDLFVRARQGFPELYGSRSVRKALVRRGLASPDLLGSLVRAGLALKRLRALPATSGLRLRLGLLEELPADGPPPPARESGGEIHYFTGCLAAHLQPSVGEAVERLCGAQGTLLGAPAGQGCCGLAAHGAGRRNEARALARRNLAAFADTSGVILTSCASCSSHLSSYPALFDDDPAMAEEARRFSARVVEFSSFFHERSLPPLPDVRPVKVFFHDPCHLRFRKGGLILPRALLDRIPGVETVGTPGGRCCGQGGLFHLGCPDLSERIFERCLEGALEAGAEMVVTTCSGCLLQWQLGTARRNLPLAVVHLARLLVDGPG